MRKDRNKDYAYYLYCRKCINSNAEEDFKWCRIRPMYCYKNDF